jgi:hypothetical protein
VGFRPCGCVLKPGFIWLTTHLLRMCAEPCCALRLQATIQQAPTSAASFRCRRCPPHQRQRQRQHQEEEEEEAEEEAEAKAICEWMVVVGA